MLKAHQYAQPPSSPIEDTRQFGADMDARLRKSLGRFSEISGINIKDLTEKAAGLSPMDVEFKGGEPFEDVRAFQSGTDALINDFETTITNLANLATKASGIGAESKPAINEEMGAIFQSLQKLLGMEALDSDKLVAPGVVESLKATKDAMKKIGEAMTALRVNIEVAKAPKDRVQTPPRAAGYVPNFFSQTQVTNQLAQQDNYKDALRKRRVCATLKRRSRIF